MLTAASAGQTSMNALADLFSGALLIWSFQSWRVGLQVHIWVQVSADWVAGEQWRLCAILEKNWWHCTQLRGSTSDYINPTELM